MRFSVEALKALRDGYMAAHAKEWDSTWAARFDDIMGDLRQRPDPYAVVWRCQFPPWGAGLHTSSNSQPLPKDNDDPSDIWLIYDRQFDRWTPR